MSPVQQIDRHYLSFSIDISVLAGGYWWEGGKSSQRGLGTERVAPLDVTQQALRNYAQALSPAYLRVGGSEADKIHYFFDDEPSCHDGTLTLTQNMWDELQRFCHDNQLKLIFTFKYGLFQRSQQGKWQADQVRHLLEYCLQHKQQIHVCELGNELNAYWAFHGLTAQPSAQKLATDFDTFIRTIREHSPNSLIAGPGSAFWPRIGETIKPISNLSAPFLAKLNEKLDLVTWHYYPFQSSRSPIRTRSASMKNLLTPASFKDFSKYSRYLVKLKDQYQPKAQVWTGETGSAQCGGQEKLSDRFVSSFWWADQLGRGALTGQKVMVRQSLVGGDYGLVNHASMKPNPDFWVSWLWKKLMGEQVYDVSSNDPGVLVYCHSANKEGRQTLLIINMTPQPKLMNCSQFGAKKRRFEITADQLTAKKVRINGIRPKFKKGKVKLKDFPKLSKLNLVSPYSINFWCFSM
ncbi:hypothetical protein GCM10027340_15290 [Marinomonas epiphytica]